DDKRIVQELSGGSAVNLLGAGMDSYFFRSDSTTSGVFLTDRLGSTISLLDPSGNSTTQYTYEPFGKAYVFGSSTNEIQYTTRETGDSISGLTFGRSRYYDPMFHRFISEDPRGLLGGSSNLYAYVDNDPI